MKILNVATNDALHNNKNFNPELFEAIINAAETYRLNRKNHNPWDKPKDAQSIFDAMKNAGLFSLHAIGGTFFGETSEKKLFILEIGDNINIAGEYNDLEEFLNDRPIPPPVPRTPMETLKKAVRDFLSR